jgi:glyoxylase-like metal-dependent hydrolase (beta-lactamase superfamily II)
MMGRLKHFLLPFRVLPGQNIVSQLRRDGIDPAEIKWVLISHLHFDHVGAIGAFPNATVLVDRREWLSQKKEKQVPRFDLRGPDLAFLEKHRKLRLVDFFAISVHGVFERGEDLFHDGSVILLDLAGHTPGSMGAWLNLPEGPVLLTGDASWVSENWRDLAAPMKFTMQDPDAYGRRLAWIQSAAIFSPNLLVLPGPDLSALRLDSRRDVVLTAIPP